MTEQPGNGDYRQVRRVYAGYAAVLLVLLALVGIAFGTFWQLARATDLNIHTYEVLDAAQEVRLGAVNIQTGFRGFVLTGVSDFLQPLEEGQALFETGLARLSQLTLENPTQQRRIAGALEIYEEWNEIHIRPGLAIRRGMSPDIELQSLLRQVNPERGRVYLANLETLLEGLRSEEMRLLEARREEMLALERLTIWMLIVGALVGLIAAGGFATIGAQQSKSLIRANRSLLQEIADRTRAEAELARISRQDALILQAAGEGICGLDAEGRFTFVNPMAERIFGWDAADLEGRSQHDVVHHSRADGSTYPLQECPIHASLVDGVVHLVENEVFWRKDGTSFPVRYVSTPIVEEGKIIGSVVTFSDITERREVEKLKDEFVSVVSHELRTPLTSIRGSLGLLASGSLGTLPVRGQRMLEIAAQNTDRLVRLINDILDIERIESGQVRMETREVEAQELVDQAIDSVRALADEAGVQLGADPAPGKLLADPDRVIQVLTNLLGNAIKFSDAGGQVLLSYEERPRMLQFTVSDTGRGIPAEKIESVFGRFQQVDASDSRRSGGTGLGLAIVRSIVQQHGGRVWVESVVGEGSRFHFTIPRPSSGVTKSRAGRRVLLCDDDEMVRETVGTRLRAQGFVVALAESGEEAIRMARRDPPDAILLDMVMPGLDGCATMLRLREDPATSEIPIVIFSAAAPSDAEFHGASDWVRKDAGDVSLFRALEKAISRGRIAEVLLVEDDKDLAEVLITMFERHDIRTVHAESCAEAIQATAGMRPDLIVLDLLLPDQDGFELVECLRRDVRFRSTPLIVYTALDLDEDQRSRLRLGTTEFMTKSRVSPAEFEERVTALIGELVHPPESPA